LTYPLTKEEIAKDIYDFGLLVGKLTECLSPIVPCGHTSLSCAPNPMTVPFLLGSGQMESLLQELHNSCLSDNILNRPGVEKIQDLIEELLSVFFSLVNLHYPLLTSY